MCDACDYNELLKSSGLGSTPGRRRVLEIIGSSTSPLTAQEITFALERGIPINRVTLYRILDLLVEHHVVDRITAGDRSYRYGLAENPNHPRHPHFYCTRCGSMECLNPTSISVDVNTLHSTYPALIERVEVRLDGVCKRCLREQRSRANREANDGARLQAKR
ncbi:MAG TPA: transcriptional repressor [Syntrophobacteraceae bacterium]|nr:transcriptional repressor [Syntrophobacteraceae bacterium]